MSGGDFQFYNFDHTAAASAVESAAPASAVPERVSKQYRPDIVQIVNVPKSHVNHTYRNYSNMPQSGGVAYVLPSDVYQMTFHEKLYHLLSFSKPLHLEAIRWSHHGRSFVIENPSKMSHFGILRSYFACNGFPQFRKQLSTHGYKPLLQDANGKEVFYSEFLLRGLPHLLSMSPPPLDVRSLLPDKHNEPNFSEISRLYPLPGEGRRELVMEARMKLGMRGFVISDEVFESVAQKWSAY